MIERIVIPGINDVGIRMLHNVKDYTQYTTAVQNLLRHKCPFCPPIDPDLNEVEFRNDRWIIWKSAFPQQHQSLHLLIVHVSHIGHISELDQDDWSELGHANRWLNDMYKGKLTGGGLALRFGDPGLNASSVPGHLHFNIQIPNGEGHVSVLLHKSKEEMELQRQRLFVYEKLRSGTTRFYDDLSDEDKKTIEGRYPKLIDTPLS